MFNLKISIISDAAVKNFKTLYAGMSEFLVFGKLFCIALNDVAYKTFTRLWLQFQKVQGWPVLNQKLLRLFNANPYLKICDQRPELKLNSQVYEVSFKWTDRKQRWETIKH